MTQIVVLPHSEYCPEGAVVEVAPGTSICEALLENDIPIEHACDMVCACTTCHVVVKDGVNNLSEMDDDEFDRVEQASDFQLNSRLGCQAIVKGDVTVHIPAWNRNYVSEGH